MQVFLVNATNLIILIINNNLKLKLSVFQSNQRKILFSRFFIPYSFKIHFKILDHCFWGKISLVNTFILGLNFVLPIIIQDSNKAVFIR